MEPSNELADLCTDGLLAVASDGSLRPLNSRMTEMLSEWGDGICRVHELPLGPSFAERWDSREGEGFGGHYEVPNSGGLFVAVRAVPHAEHEWVLVCSEETELVAVRAELQRLRRLRNLSAMVRGLAHDFNNVLGSIIGFSDHLAQSALTEDLQFFFEHMQVSASKGATLLRCVTDYMSKTGPVLERTDLGGLIDDVLVLVEKTTILLGVEVVRQPMTAPVSVWSARGAALEFLTQVCLHYIGVDISTGVELELHSGREELHGREFGFVEIRIPGDPVHDAFLDRLIEKPEAGLLEPAAAMPVIGNLLLDGLVALRLGGGEIRSQVLDGRRCLWVGYPLARVVQ